MSFADPIGQMPDEERAKELARRAGTLRDMPPLENMGGFYQRRRNPYAGEGGFGPDPTALDDTFSTKSLDVYGLNGVTRIPVNMASGKSALLDMLGHGLGWAPDDPIDGPTASSRIRSYLDLQSGVRGADTPDISPQMAVQMAREKLDAARNQLMAHLDSGAPQPEPMDPTAVSGYMDRMYPHIPAPGDPATLADVPPTQRWLALGYALGNLLRGGSLGDVAPMISAPIAAAQKQMDADRQVALQNMAIDSDRARAEFGLAQSDIEKRRQSMLLDYTTKAKTLQDQVDEAQRVFRETTNQNMRSWGNEDRDTFKKVFDSNIDTGQRMLAVDELYSRGRLSDEEYPRYMAIASVKSSKQVANEALAEARKAGAAKTRVQTELLPKEYQLRAGELARRISRDEDDAQIARDRLGIMADKNAITLNLGYLRDSTANRRIDLQAPLWDAQIANYISQAEGRKDSTLKGLVGTYDGRLKEYRSESDQIRDDLAKVYKSLASKEVRKSPEAKANLEAFAADLEKRLADVERKTITLQGERDDLAESYTTTARARGTRPPALGGYLPVTPGGGPPQTSGALMGGATGSIGQGKVGAEKSKDDKKPKKP